MMNLSYVAIAVIVIAVAVVVIRRSRSGTGAGAEGDLRRTLRNRIMGDDSAAQRLIELERKRRPGAPEKELIEAALRRLERDNR